MFFPLKCDSEELICVDISLWHAHTVLRQYPIRPLAPFCSTTTSLVTAASS